MNFQRKQAAVTRYQPLITEGKTETEVKEELAADDKKFTPDEIDEIYRALTGPSDVSNQVKVNFGVDIPELGKAYTKAELEADQDAIDYLIEIGSKAVTLIKK